MQLSSAGKEGTDNGGKGRNRRGVSLPEALFTVDDARELLTVRSFGPERHRTNYREHRATGARPSRTGGLNFELHFAEPVHIEAPMECSDRPIPAVIPWENAEQREAMRRPPGTSSLSYRMSTTIVPYISPHREPFSPVFFTSCQRYMSFVPMAAFASTPSTPGPHRRRA